MVSNPRGEQVFKVSLHPWQYVSNIRARSVEEAVREYREVNETLDWDENDWTVYAWDGHVWWEVSTVRKISYEIRAKKQIDMDAPYE